MTDDQELASSVRAALAGSGAIREVRMFGGIGFMLNGAGEQTATAKLNRLAFGIERGHVHDVGACDVGEHFGKAQTTFRAGNRVAHRSNSRIDQDQGHVFLHISRFALHFDRRWPVSDAAHVDDCELNWNANLLGGKPDAFEGVHGLEHVADELLDGRRDRLDGRPFLAQDRRAVFNYR